MQTTGRLMSRMTNDVAQVQRVVSETIGDLARESLTLVGYVTVLLVLRRATRGRLLHERAAHRLSARASGPARAAHDAAHARKRRSR